MATTNAFPGFETIKYFYDGGYYTNKQIKRYVELNCLTKEEYKTLTGDVFPEENTSEG